MIRQRVRSTSVLEHYLSLRIQLIEFPPQFLSFLVQPFELLVDLFKFPKLRRTFYRVIRKIGRDSVRRIVEVSATTSRVLIDLFRQSVDIRPHSEYIGGKIKVVSHKFMYFARQNGVVFIVNFQRFSTLDARKLVNGPKMSAHHRGICHF